MTEAETQARIMLAVGAEPGVRLFRNNTGQGWCGDADVIRRSRVVSLAPGDVVVRHARPVTFGLCIGSSDLIGWRTVVVTSAMVGSRLALFAAAEVKTDTGAASKDQRNFIAQVTAAGGLAGVVRSVEQARSLFDVSR